MSNGLVLSVEALVREKEQYFANELEKIQYDKENQNEEVREQTRKVFALQVQLYKVQINNLVYNKKQRAARMGRARSRLAHLATVQAGRNISRDQITRRWIVDILQLLKRNSIIGHEMERLIDNAQWDTRAQREMWRQMIGDENIRFDSTTRPFGTSENRIN